MNDLGYENECIPFYWHSMKLIGFYWSAGSFQISELWVRVWVNVSVVCVWSSTIDVCICFSLRKKHILILTQIFLVDRYWNATISSRIFFIRWHFFRTFIRFKMVLNSFALSLFWLYVAHPKHRTWPLILITFDASHKWDAVHIESVQQSYDSHKTGQLLLWEGSKMFVITHTCETTDQSPFFGSFQPMMER